MLLGKLAPEIQNVYMSSTYIFLGIGLDESQREIADLLVDILLQWQEENKQTRLKIWHT